MRTNNSESIQRELLRKAALPKNKYNFPLLHHVEQMVDGACSDRTEYDAGMHRSDNNNNQ